MTFRLDDARTQYRNRLERARARQIGYTSELRGYGAEGRHLHLACLLEPEFLKTYPLPIARHAAALAYAAEAYVPPVDRYTVGYALAVRPRGRDIAFDRLMEADLDVHRLDAELDHISFLYGTPPEDDEVFVSELTGDAPAPAPVVPRSVRDPEAASPALLPWLRRVIVLPEQLTALREIGLYAAVFEVQRELN